jgi:hypothetical protein
MIMDNKLKKAVCGSLIGLSLLGTLASGSAKSIDSKEENVQQRTVVKGKEPNFNAPVYSESDVPANYCSRYVRYAGEYLFGEKIAEADAWNLRYHGEVIPINGKSLDQLADEGVLQPGDVIGMSYPRSSHRKDNDETGHRVKYTHVGIYLGKKEHALVAEKFGKKTILQDESGEKARGVTPYEIIRFH